LTLFWNRRLAASRYNKLNAHMYISNIWVKVKTVIGCSVYLGKLYQEFTFLECVYQKNNTDYYVYGFLGGCIDLLHLYP